ncbi:MAG: efflux RND transporter periplasmic adaptor subunit [Thermoanaerobaculia bacterium]
MRGRGRVPVGVARRAIAVMLAAGTAAGGCRREKGSTIQPVPVRVAPAEPAGSVAGVRYSANIRPREQVALAFKSGGYVREILKARGADGNLHSVQQGDAVARGTVLARVRETDYRERVNQAQAALQEAEAALEKQRLDFERAQKLFSSKSLARADFDGARAAFEGARARVSGMRAQLDAARIALADCALVAPMDAIVLARHVEEGSLVGSGTVGFTLADTTAVKAIFGVPDTIVRNLKIGTPLTLSVEAVPGVRLPGRITAIAASAETQSRVFDVEVTIPNAEGRLRAGMIASVETPREYPGGRAAAALPAVPLTAILKSPSNPRGFAVFVLGETAGQPVARVREVELGGIVDNRIAVTSGLAVGERVIVTGTTIVTDGSAVRVIP